MTRRILCLILALLTVLSLGVCGYADGDLSPLPAEPAAEPAPDPTAGPVPEATAGPVPEATAEPVPEATAEPVPEATAEPVPETTAEPVPEATAEPVPEATAEPIPEATAIADDGVAPALAGQPGFRQSLAQQLLALVNALRTSNPQLVEGDGYRTVTGLSALRYDSALETAAKQVAQSGSSSGQICVRVKGPITAEAAFAKLANEGGTYDGQDDRRTMLRGDILSMGAACYVNEDGVYCWAIVFSTGAGSGAKPTPEDSASAIVASGDGWELRDSGVLTITNDAAMADYDGTIVDLPMEYPVPAPIPDPSAPKTKPAPWSAWSSDINTVNISAGVTKIGAYAFSSCWSLTRVTIPATVTSIGESAFNWCASLRAVDIPAGVRTIGASAFAGCSELTSVTLPEGVASLGSAVFFGCGKLTTVTLPRSLTDIGPAAFDEMCSGQRVAVPCDAAELIARVAAACPGVPIETHTWNSGVVTKEPTRDETGVRTYTCTKCSAQRTESIPRIKEGWYKENGQWCWYEKDGPTSSKRAANKLVDGDRYYVDGNGVMRTGWINAGGTWYYADRTGLLQSGWQYLGKKWYWMDPTNKNAMATGWRDIGGCRYYFQGGGSGVMVTGWQYIDGSWYYFRSSGAMATGWLYIGRTWYWLDPQKGGAMATGWRDIGGCWYYFLGGSSGAMVTGWQYLGGSWYYFLGSGAMATGWVYIGRTWYWLDANGVMAAGESLTIGGLEYCFAGDGAMRTGWINLGGGDWKYANSSGAIVKNQWVKSGRYWYFLNADGMMARDETVESIYYVNNDGVWIR